MSLKFPDRHSGTGSQAILNRYGRTFSFAGQLLSGKHLADAATLYALCREVDDLADNAKTDSDRANANQELLALEDALSERGPRSVKYTWLYEITDDLFSGQPVGVSALRDMVGAIRSDLQPVSMKNRQALLQYCYGAAGTVGVMMSCLLGARPLKNALPHAIDLGIGMQLTNIARDVLEDAELGRVYLPAIALDSALVPEALVAGETEARALAWKGVREILRLAETYYRSGWAGLTYLPFRARLSIAVAARLYQEIGHQILRRGESGYWQGRVVVNRRRKLWISIRTLACLLSGQGAVSQPVHNDELHTYLSTCLNES